MASEQSIWYRIGYALERAKQAPPAARQTLSGLAERIASDGSAKHSVEKPPPRESWPTVDELIASGATALVARVLDGWRPRRKAGVARLLRAGTAGAGAALLVDLVRPLLQGRAELPGLDRETADRVLVGVGRGLVYGAAVEPRVPGPAAVKGALFGSAEYAMDPMGGLSHLLGPHAPQGRLPVVAHLLEELDPHDRAFLEHVAFGIALAVLYGSSPSSNGIRLEIEEE